MHRKKIDIDFVVLNFYDTVNINSFEILMPQIHLRGKIILSPGNAYISCILNQLAKYVSRNWPSPSVKREATEITISSPLTR